MNHAECRGNHRIFYRTQARRHLPVDGRFVPADGDHRMQRIRGRKRRYRGKRPVIRESGGDRSAVTGGTRILSIG